MELGLRNSLSPDYEIPPIFLCPGFSQDRVHFFTEGAWLSLQCYSIPGHFIPERREKGIFLSSEEEKGFLQIEKMWQGRAYGSLLQELSV